MTAPESPPEYEEFKGSVAFVGREEFWRAKDLPPTGQAYHWNTSAGTYYLIGDAMGNVMTTTCDTKPAK